MEGRHRGTTVLAWLVCSLVFSALLSLIVAAHGDEVDDHDDEMVPPAMGNDGKTIVNLVEATHAATIKVLSISSLLLLLLVIISLAYEKKINKMKVVLFSLIIVIVIGATAFLVISTIYLNVISVTKGPVHWHADYEVWVCGEKIRLTAPQGVSNRVGSPTLHEHGDDRIHIEGVVHNIRDVSLGQYLSTIGGSLTQESFRYPTDEGMVAAENGDACPDGRAGVINVYVNGHKIKQPASYVPSPEENVPPGDCIIIAFGPDDETTNKVCTSWRAKGWVYEDGVKNGGS